MASQGSPAYPSPDSAHLSAYLAALSVSSAPTALRPEHSLRNRLRSIQRDAEAVVAAAHALQCLISRVDDPNHSSLRPATLISSDGPPPSSAPVTSSSSSSPPHHKSTTQRIAGAFPPPPLALVANARCGSWYVPPSSRTATAYFKSTDGHRNEWAFSTRRLNLHLLSILGRTGSCIVVDATRDHTVSDAHSKTIPIWCAVMNRLLFPDQRQHHGLITDERCVSREEHLAIESRLDRFVQTAKALELDLDALRRATRRPVRAHLYTSCAQPLQMARANFSSETSHLICLSATSHPHSADEMTFTYIAGAGDDAESWALDLTPDSFWANACRFVALSDEADFEQAVCEIVREAKETTHVQTIEYLSGPIHIRDVPPPFFVGSVSSRAAIEAVRWVGDALEAARLTVDAAIVCCYGPSSAACAPTREEHEKSKLKPEKHRNLPVITLHCPPGKEGSRALRSELLRVEPFLQERLSAGVQPRMLYLSTVDVDLAVAVAVAITCVHFDGNGRFVPEGLEREEQEKRGGKAFVRKRLVQIQNVMHMEMINDGANVIRATTLKAVNEFVMGRRPEKSPYKRLNGKSVSEKDARQRES